jgi:hypothetical protein
MDHLSYPEAGGKQSKNSFSHGASKSRKLKGFANAPLTQLHSAKARDYNDLKPGSAPYTSSQKGAKMEHQARVRVIPVSGDLEFPAIQLRRGKLEWDFLFLSLMNWLPELDGLEIEAQDKVLIQYKANSGWRPLAGDEQLKNVLEEFGNSEWNIYVRCAPPSEFESGSEASDMEHDDGDSDPGPVLRRHEYRSSVRADKDNAKNVG